MSDQPRAARRPKVAFVLGGGGHNGAYEVGMLRALFEDGVKPDVIVGTSVGAMNGAAVAASHIFRFASCRSRCLVPTDTSTASRFCRAAPRLYATPVATAMIAPATITGYVADADGEAPTRCTY